MKQVVAKIISEVLTGKERLRVKAGDEVENFSVNAIAVEVRIMEIKDKMNS